MNSRLRMMLIAITIIVLGAGVAAAQDPIVQVIHNSPNAPAVDIYLNDGATPAIPALDFREATGLVALPAGMYTVGIAPAPSAGPEDIIATFGPYDLMDGTQTVIMAGGELGADFNLFVNALETGAPADQVNLLAFHGAPDAPAVDVAAVDVGILITNLEYLTFQGYLAVPAADYILTIAPTGGEPIAAFQAPLSGFGGGAAVVFASGYLGMDPAFGLFVALNDGTVLALPGVPTPTESSTWSNVKAIY